MSYNHVRDWKLRRKIITQDPIDKTAALVVSKGPDYGIKTSTQSGHDSPYPIATSFPPTNILDRTGQRRGRFTVIGFHSTRKTGRKGYIADHKWVVRCSCRDVTLERALDPDECCGRCQYLKVLKKRSK